MSYALIGVLDKLGITLYQCFLTLPSVRFGKVFRRRSANSKGQVGPHILTFAISLQEVPASLSSLSLFSSAGVQGVLVRVFLAGGPDELSAAASAGWLGPPGSTNGSCADVLGSIFRFLPDVAGEGAGRAREMAGVEVI